jgi:hypothetical protein
MAINDLVDKEASLAVQSPFDDFYTLNSNGIYVFDISNVSKKGFDINISKGVGKENKHVTSMPVIYKTKGPVSFLPEFDSFYREDNFFKLTNFAVSYAIRTLKKTEVSENFRLLLESDFDNSYDKGKERLFIFEAIGKVNKMHWVENKHGQEYISRFN